MGKLAKNVPKTGQKQLSGGQATRITIRVPHSLAERLREGAARDGVSINQYILYLLARRTPQ